MVSFFSPIFAGSPCSDPNHVPTILPADPGELKGTVTPQLLPPAEAPLPALEVANVVDPPLPAVANVNKTSPPTAPIVPPPPPPSGAWANAINPALSLMSILVFHMLFTGH